ATPGLPGQHADDAGLLCARVASYATVQRAESARDDARSDRAVDRDDDSRARRRKSWPRVLPTAAKLALLRGVRVHLGLRGRRLAAQSDDLGIGGWSVH